MYKGHDPLVPKPPEFVFDGSMHDRAAYLTWVATEYNSQFNEMLTNAGLKIHIALSSAADAIEFQLNNNYDIFMRMVALTDYESKIKVTSPPPSKEYKKNV